MANEDLPATLLYEVTMSSILRLAISAILEYVGFATYVITMKGNVSYHSSSFQKCLRCPDFDTCLSCFHITPREHPNHPFVKIKDVQHLVRFFLHVFSSFLLILCRDQLTLLPT